MPYAPYGYGRRWLLESHKNCNAGVSIKLLIHCCLRRVFHQLQLRGDQQDLRPVLGRGVPRCGQQLRRGRGGRPRAPVEQRQPANFDELRISTMTRTTTCRSGGFALAVAPPPAMVVAPLRKFIVNVSVRLLRPPYANTASVRPVRRRTRRTITRTSSLTLYA